MNLFALILQVQSAKPRDNLVQQASIRQGYTSRLDPVDELRRRLRPRPAARTEQAPDLLQTPRGVERRPPRPPAGPPRMLQPQRAQRHAGRFATGARGPRPNGAPGRDGLRAWRGFRFGVLALFCHGHPGARALRQAFALPVAGRRGHLGRLALDGPPPAWPPAWRPSREPGRGGRSGAAAAGRAPEAFCDHRCDRAPRGRSCPCSAAPASRGARGPPLATRAPPGPLCPAECPRTPRACPQRGRRAQQAGGPWAETLAMVRSRPLCHPPGWPPQWPPRWPAPQARCQRACSVRPRPVPRTPRPGPRPGPPGRCQTPRCPWPPSPTGHRPPCSETAGYRVAHTPQRRPAPRPPGRSRRASPPGCGPAWCSCPWAWPAGSQTRAGAQPPR